MLYQRTLRKPVTVAGIGLHSGKPAKLVFRPAPEGSGIHFVRKDLSGSPAIKVSADNVQATQLATTLGGKDFQVATIEHCLSSVAAYRIDNLTIELDGPEIPICDGSARDFAEKILAAGFVDQDQVRKYIYVTKPIMEGNEEKHVYVFPYNGLKVSATIDFTHPSIGKQELEIEINEKTEATLVSDPMHVTWNSATNQTMITVQNTGDLILNITGTNIILNGSMMNVTQRGVNPSIWLPGSIVNFTVQGNIQLSTNDEVFLTVIVLTDSLNPTQGVYSFTEVVRIV